MTTKRTSLLKGSFHSLGLRLWNNNKDMFTKLANNNIYTGCLVPFFSSVEAEQYGVGIMKIGSKLRKLCLFKPSYYKV